MIIQTGYQTEKFCLRVALKNSSFDLSKVAAVAKWLRYRIMAGMSRVPSPVPLRTHRIGERCTLNLSRAQTSSRWCGVVVLRERCQLRCRPRHLTRAQNDEIRRQTPSSS
ncbi:uncharacterized protein TNCV_410991 [Trichonephila clavipes]|nr:uncharacterized protein TNCV_410991 [Trichonephila clavipes]